MHTLRLIARWLAATGATFFLAMFWLPPIYSEPPGARPPRDWTRLVLIATVLLLFIAVTVPLRTRRKGWVVAALALLTSLAWVFEDDLRLVLGSPFTG